MSHVITNISSLMIEQEAGSVQLLHFMWLFAVQRVFIREMWEDLARQWYIEGGRGNCRPCDICVSAPTGSGKTLAYVLPIIQVIIDWQWVVVWAHKTLRSNEGQIAPFDYLGLSKQNANCQQTLPLPTD